MRKNGLVLGVCFAALVGYTQVDARQQKAQNLAGEEEVSADPERSYTIRWEGVKTLRALDDHQVAQVSCSNCRQRGESYVPYFVTYRDLPAGVESIDVSVSNPVTSILPGAQGAYIPSEALKQDFKATTYVKRSAGKKVAVIMVEVLRQSGSQIERLDAFDLEIIQTASASRGGRSGHSWKPQSILASGSWMKLATARDGVYRVAYADLVRHMGVQGSFASTSIRLYGTGAGMLPMANSKERPDDLDPISVKIVDGGDGSFDQGDYFLFYGEDQVTWSQDDERFAHSLNPFSDSAYYFLSIGGEGEQRTIQPLVETSPSNRSSSTYDFLAVHEEENTNLIKSGRTWYGEQLGIVTSLDFGFSVPQIDRSSNVKLRARFAARSIGLSGVSLILSLPSQGAVQTSASVSPVADFYGALYARDITLELSATPRDGDLLTKVELDNAANPLAQAWIDYIELNARRNLSFLAPSMTFRDKQSVGSGNVTEFRINASEAIEVWDVTDPHRVHQMPLSGGVTNGYRFVRKTDTLREFVCFTENGYLAPKFAGAMQNQNLHALSSIQYLIVAHPSFVAQAERLASLHESIDGLTSAVVTPKQIYNEFSGGAQDITAIKEFIRKLYFEADSLGGLKPQYLLLLGDASYDYKDKISGNSNFVPTHQMKNSLSPTGSIASDDFYGLLDDDEGESAYDFLDIGVGRLPARSRKEAEDMVNKIIGYANTSASFGEWRNVVAFVADDADPGDGHTFMRDFEGLGGIIDDGSPEFVVRKLYMDSYKQQVGSGGERYPEGAEAITERVEKGALMAYYIGHGGELGWGHERILEVPTINKWENDRNLPLFVTATCEFARFDDPRRTSGGEYTLLNPNGGGVALLTTTRAVYANPNLILSTEFTDAAFRSLTVDKPRLGDLMLQTKVRTLDTNSTAALNSRSFALLGDPALRLAYPELSIIVTAVPDTIRALEKVKVEGYVADVNGSVLEDFNGVLYPSVFDKELALQTLDNDGSGAFDYEEWKNLVFKGKTSVKDGLFSFEFVVPKDIKKPFGPGRINLYAEDGQRDAHGDFREFIIGGISDNPIQDDQGPEVKLYMNNTKFIFGGLTDEHPDLYAEVRDDNGINMVGSGIGHDITAVLDNETANTMILNDYYEAKIDSYTEGTIRYPFRDLEEGRHSLKLQVWDVNNNPGDAYTEFVVASSEEMALEHVLNYPNPFTTNTQFFFEHNKPGQELDVKIEVFTVAGKLVKTLGGAFYSDGFRVGPIPWNGRDEYGDQLAKGVYLYKVAVKTPVGESVEKYERLVLLK